MEMKSYIEMGEKRAGKQIELAKMLKVSDSYLRMIKTGRRGLPDDLCIVLADYIGADRLEVIAASNLVTEKDEEKRKVFESCFKKNNNAAASVLSAAIIISILTFAPAKPAQAQGANAEQCILCKIGRKRRTKRGWENIRVYFDKLLNVAHENIYVG